MLNFQVLCKCIARGVKITGFYEYMFSPMEYKEAISENIPKNLMINHKLFSYKHIFSDITLC